MANKDYASKLFGPKTPVVVNNQNNTGRLEQTPARFKMTVADFVEKYGMPTDVRINRRSSRNGEPIRGYQFGMDIIEGQNEVYPTQALLEAGFTMQDFKEVLKSKNPDYLIVNHIGSQDVYLTVPLSKSDKEADPSLLNFED